MKKFSSLHWFCIFSVACGVFSAGAAEPTAFQLIKEGDRYIGEPSRDNVLAIYSDKSLVGLMPAVWYVDYFDPDARCKIVEIKFGAGLKLDVKRPLKPFWAGGRQGNILDLAKLKTDSDVALSIATSQELLKPLSLKHTQMWLERNDYGLVWKVRIWAARLSDSKVTVEIGDVYISPEDGKIIRANLHVDRAR